MAVPAIVTLGSKEGLYPLPLSVIIILLSVPSVTTAVAVAVLPDPPGAAIVTAGTLLYPVSVPPRVILSIPPEW